MMRKLTIVAAAFLIASCGGGINSYESAMNAQADLMEQMVKVLEGVNDEKSAEKAAEKIEAIGTQMAEIAKKVQELPQPSRDEMQKISKKQMEMSKDFQAKATGQMMKLAQYPALSQAWMKAMESSR